MQGLMRQFESCAKRRWSFIYTCLLVLVVRCCVSAEDVMMQRSLFKRNACVVDLKNLKLSEADASAGMCPWILMAYSDGCGHCRSTAPKVAEAVVVTFRNASDDLHGVSVGALNCEVGVEWCMALGIRGVPSFFLLFPSWLSSPAGLEMQDSVVFDGAEAKVEMKRVALPTSQGVSGAFDVARETWNSVKRGHWNSSMEERCIAMRSDLYFAKKGYVRTLTKNEVDNNADSEPGFEEERKLHATDIANAFFYTLYHEVSISGYETVEQRRALTMFLKAVQHCLPGLEADVILYSIEHHAAMKKSFRSAENENNATPSAAAGEQSVAPAITASTTTFTPAPPAASHEGSVDRIVASLSSISISDWQNILLSSAVPYLGNPRSLEWHTCRGSSWEYRGFPCGMWLLYHSLTTNSCGVSAEADGISSSRILFIIHDYVRSFFSCTACRLNFLSQPPNTYEDPAMQLWLSHNRANYHLANTTSGADPFVPKRQFPTRDICPECYLGTEVGPKIGEEFNKTAVAAFLRSWYAWEPVALHTTKDNTVVEEVETPSALKGAGIIVVRRDPFSMNIFLTLTLIFVLVVLGVHHGLRRLHPATRRRLPVSMRRCV